MSTDPDADSPIDPEKYAGGLTPLDGNDDGDKDREKRCEECRSRVTVGTDGSTEYGHEYGCPERPASFRQRGNAYAHREHIDSESDD